MPPRTVADSGELAEEDLARAVVEGDRSAFADLYDRYERRAFSLARRICCDSGLAQDVVQETFLAFWQAPERFDARRGRFSSWLLMLVHHRAVDAVRRQTAAGRRIVDTADGDEDGTSRAGPGAEDDALAAVDAGHVRDALGALPVDQRSALTLAYFGGYTQREIATLTGVPVGTVKSRMFTGIRRMRDLLGPRFDDPLTRPVEDTR